MRISFLFPTPNFSGGCRVVAIYAQGLADKGHDVTIIAIPAIKYSFISNIKRILKKECWIKNEPRGHEVRKSHFYNLTGVSINLLSSLRIIQNNDVPDGDIVIATWWETAEWLIELDKSKGEKYYFVQGHEVHSHLPVERVKATYRLPLKKITIAQWLVDVMSNKYDAKDVNLVSNGVDTSMFKAPLRGKQNIPTFSLMYATEEFKGLDISIAAFEYAKKKYPQIKLLVFGSKDLDGSINLPEGAIFYLSPSQNEIKEIYSNSDGYIFSSRSEGFGLPVLEAMACRCPVIATMAGCAPDFIEHGVNGELNDIDDFIAQGESIIRFIEMNNLDWRDMSEKAYLAVENNSWGASINQFESILSESCSK